MNKLRYLCVIPARWASHSLPGKPLLQIGGKTMLEHVYRRARATGLFFRIIIAADDVRIYDAAERFRADVLMTREDHPDGSSRAAEIAARINSDAVMMIQCDEPMFDPRMAHELADGLAADRTADAAVMCAELTREEDIDNPERVKVVRSQNGHALYFSRSPIPYPRNERGKVWEMLGLCAFRKDVLSRLSGLCETPLMKTEGVGLLRLLEHGFKVAAITTKFPHEMPTVKTEADLEAVRRAFVRRKCE